MRTLYLIRHGQPVQKHGPCCISHTELPLDAVGREQAAALKEWLTGRGVAAIYSSPAARCTETARIISGGTLPLFQRDNLWEVSVGLWEGLPFSEIQRRWPEEYAARGANLSAVAPPDGESFTAAALRMDNAVSRILAETQGNVAIVSHGGILRAWLSRIQGRDLDKLFSLPQPWGCISTVQAAANNFQVSAVGEKPGGVPGPMEQSFLLDKCRTPHAVRLHCQAVAKEALRLAGASKSPVDRKLLECACLLHDLLRAEGRSHPEKGAAVLEKAGYPYLAAIIAQHHDLQADAPPEAELLYLADKLVSGTELVPLEARFEASRVKCATPEAVMIWERRYQTALSLRKKYS